MSSQLSEATSDSDRLMRDARSLPEGTIKAVLSEVHAFVDNLVKYVSGLGRELSLEAYRWNPEGLVTMRVKNTGREKVSISGLRCDGEREIIHVWYNGILPENSTIIQFSHSPIGTEHEVNVIGGFEEYPFKLQVGRMDEIRFEDIEAAERRRMRFLEDVLPRGMKKIDEMKLHELWKWKRLSHLFKPFFEEYI